jgi:nucleoside-diphosphate-sugar epimerase
MSCRRRALVTGCAGFLGSQLAERLVAGGREVLGVDCFTAHYARAAKERNLERLRDEPAFALLDLDLSRAPLEGMLDGVDVVFHLAAQPGVRGSFGERFEQYVRNNIVATQRLLEQAARWPITAFVFASSSSVYGDAAGYPTAEVSERRPVSPYGMTKAATEELAWVYRRCFGVPAVGVRYFTAYGPRQRPDMSFARFFGCALAGRPVPVNGDGHQIRDFTFVDDVLTGTLAAARFGRAGSVYNIGGGSPVELLDAIRLIGELTGRTLELDRRPAPIGEARRTSCDGNLARRELGFVPRIELRDGLGAQLEWILGTRRGRRVATVG